MLEKTLKRGREKELDLLTCAFKNFTQATETLKDSYKKLQQKISELNGELSKTNRTLSRKVAELNRVQTYLNNILDSMMDGLFAVDVEGKITIFNRAAEKITGYKAKDVLNRPYEVVFGRENKDFVYILKKTFRKKKPLAEERHFFSQDKDLFLEIIINPVNSSQGKTEGIVVVFRDVSALRYLKEEIRRKEKMAMLGEMAASIAHEVRNPLSGIEGFALLLKESLSEDKEKSVWIDHIIKGARSLNNLVTSLLNFSRPLKPDFQTVIVDKLIEYTICIIQKKIEKEKLRISVIKDFPLQPVEMVADPDLLKQVFLNLALNAIEAMPGGGKLTIKVSKRKYLQYESRQFLREIDGDYIISTSCEEVLIEFSDTGCGIPLKERKKIFRPFYTTKSKGYGLGLSVVQQIVQSHGGKVKLESKPGEGTTFVLSFPLITSLREVKNGCREYSCGR